MKEPVRSKTHMYGLLLSGAFGNTNPGHTSVSGWLNSPDRDRYPTWGIRPMQAGDSRRRFDVATADVLDVIKEFGFAEGQYNISPMVNHVHRFFGEAWRSPDGLRLFGCWPAIGEAGPSAFAARGREWTGLAAKLILDTVMWPSDRDAFDELLDDYPDHVVEFTACWKAHGTIPNRNCVIWEVRVADGTYEKWI